MSDGLIVKVDHAYRKIVAIVINFCDDEHQYFSLHY